MGMEPSDFHKASIPVLIYSPIAGKLEGIRVLPVIHSSKCVGNLTCCRFILFSSLVSLKSVADTSNTCVLLALVSLFPCSDSFFFFLYSNNFGCILGIGNIMLEASCLKPLENAAVQLDLSYKLQCCFSISPISRMPLPAVSHASGAACQGPVGGPGNSAVYDEVHTRPA